MAWLGSAFPEAHDYVLFLMTSSRHPGQDLVWLRDGHWWLCHTIHILAGSYPSLKIFAVGTKDDEAFSGSMYLICYLYDFELIATLPVLRPQVHESISSQMLSCPLNLRALRARATHWTNRSILLGATSQICYFRGIHFVQLTVFTLIRTCDFANDWDQSSAQ